MHLDPDGEAGRRPKSEAVTEGDYAAALVRSWLWMADPEQFDDLASDMSRFHGIRDIGAMRSSALARLSLRIGAYGGALAAPRRPVAPPQPPPERRRPDPGPAASAETLRRLLAPIPGSQMWGNVVVVPKDQQDPPPDASEPAE